MKFTKVSVTKSIESANKYGLRSWDKISTEIELDDPNDTIEKAYQFGRQFITEKVSELTEKQVGEEPVIQQDGVSEELQAILDGINACTEIEGDNGLKSFWMSSKKNLKLVDAYNTKLKQLKNAAGKE